MEALLAFGAALLAVRLSGLLASRWRATRSAGFAAWSAGLGAYSLGAAALAWGAAAGWDDRAFRAYYLFGGLLTAPLLGAGSLLGRGSALGVGRRLVGPVALVYSGLALGVAASVPLTPPVDGVAIPEAQVHLDLFPARILAIVGNVAGTVALVALALAGLRRRPLGNSLLLAGVAVAAAGSALAGLGVGQTALFVAVAAVLIYAGAVTRR